MKYSLFFCVLFLGFSLGIRAAVPAGNPRFLNQKEAAAAIVDDRDAPYFSRLQPIEIEAKCLLKDAAKPLPQLQTEARATYAAESQEFTEAEKTLLCRTVREVNAMVEPEFPLVARTPWMFLKVSGKIEGGCPHTRGGCIVLPGPLMELFVRSDRPEQQPMVRYFLGKLLLHEQIHVLQRKHPLVFASLYTDVWGFRRIGRLQSHPWLIERGVVNPDGPDTCWVYPLKHEGGKVQWIWPLLLLNGRDGEPIRMPRDFVMAAVRVTEADGGFKVQTTADGSPDYRPIAEVRDYADAFPSAEEAYHPNEITADLIASYIAQHAILPKGAPLPQGEHSLDKWAASIDWLKAHLR